MQIEIWSIGKESDSYIHEGVSQYIEKMAPWVAVKLEILQPGKSKQTADIALAKAQEEAMVLKRLQSRHYLILLDEGGKMHTSPQWAQQFQDLMNMGTKTVVLLIGGAHGVSAAIKQRAQKTWSLSALVFPHQLVRLMVAEQLYRAFSIIKNTPYHHS